MTKKFTESLLDNFLKTDDRRYIDLSYLFPTDRTKLARNLLGRLQLTYGKSLRFLSLLFDPHPDSKLDFKLWCFLINKISALMPSVGTLLGEKGRGNICL